VAFVVAGRLFGAGLFQLSFGLGPAKEGGVLIAGCAGGLAGRLLFHLPKIDDLGHAISPWG
jgi:hypothetical protein